MSVLRGVYVSKLRVREIGWKYRNVRNATNLVFTLESGISFMFNSTVQQVKSTKKVQNGKTKALDPGSAFCAYLENCKPRPNFSAESKAS